MIASWHPVKISRGQIWRLIKENASHDPLDTHVNFVLMFPCRIRHEELVPHIVVVLIGTVSVPLG